MYNATGFYNVSGYYFLILKFPVVPQDAKKCVGGGYRKKFSARFARRLYPPLSKTWRRPCLVVGLGIRIRLG